jgi:hypothetical protein
MNALKDVSTWLISDPAAEVGTIETTPKTRRMAVLTRQELAQNDFAATNPYSSIPKRSH